MNSVPSLFEAALFLSKTQRHRFLEEKCRNDPELHQKIENLVAAYWRESNLLASPPGPPSSAAQKTATPSVGEQVAHFEIVGKIGEGGMGAVFLAQDTLLDRRVAIKFLLDVIPEMTGRFIVEAKALARCTHPNIVSIYEVGEYHGCPYLVLEYQQGETLRSFLRTNGPLPVSQLLQIMIQVASALVCAHGAGIIHRDLKPENILITPDLQTKVLDFGLAKLLSDPREAPTPTPTPPPAASISRNGLVLGTLPYMSPEQWQATGVDWRSDIWAVGVMMFEMLLGSHPLSPITLEKLAEVQNVQVPMPSARERVERYGRAREFDARLKTAELADQCLLKDRESRLSDAKLLLEQLRCAQDLSTAPRFRKPRFRKGAAAAAVIVASTLTLGLLIFIIMSMFQISKFNINMEYPWIQVTDVIKDCPESRSPRAVERDDTGMAHNTFCTLDIRILNKSKHPITIDRVLLRLLHGVRPIGHKSRMDVSAQYGVDISNMREAGQLIEVTVAQFVGPESADRFVIKLTASELSSSAWAHWAFHLALKTSDGLVAGGEIAIGIHGSKQRELPVVIEVEEP